MPTLRIPTDRGILRVPVDREPSSPEEMQQIAEQAIAQMSGGDAPIEEPASMTKEAVPAPYEPGFLQTLLREISGGAEDIKSGLGEMFSLPNQGEVNPMSGALRAGMGGLRTLTSPITAAGSQVGESIGETIRNATESYLGPTGSALAGTAIGAPANVATQILGAPAAISKLAPYAMQGAQGIARSLPGAQVTLREMAKKVIDTWPSALRPSRASEEIYQEVNQLNPTVILSDFSKAALGVAAKESRLSQYGIAHEGIGSTARALGESTASTPVLNLPKELPFQDVRAIRQRIGEKIGELRSTNGVGLGDYKRLFKILSQELEDAAVMGARSANTPAARAAYQKLKQANETANREFSLQELDDIFTATMGKAREGTEFTSSNFAQALNKIRQLRRDEPLFEKGLGTANLNRIENRLDEFRQLKILPPPKSVNVGSALVATRLGAGTGLGFALGNLFGGPQLGATLGGMGGFAAAVGPPIVSRIMQSDAGSKALMRILKSEGTVSAKQIGSIFALIQGEEATRNHLIDNVRSALKSDTVSIEDKIRAAMRKDSVFRQVTEAEAVLGQ